MKTYDPTDYESPEAIRADRVGRWVKTQPKWYQPYFCRHGRYIGFKRALSFTCPSCSEEDND